MDSKELKNYVVNTSIELYNHINDLEFINYTKVFFYENDIRRITQVNIDKIVDILNDRIDYVVRRLDGFICIPEMLNLVEEIYYGRLDRKRDIHIAQSAKIAIIYLFKDLNKSEKYSKSDKIRQMINLSKLCYVKINLDLFKLFFLVYPGEVLESSQVEKNKSYTYFKEVMFRESRKLGRIQRVSKTMSKMFVENSYEYAVAIDSVINGVNPRDIKLFKKTFLEAVPSINDEYSRGFWERLQALNMFIGQMSKVFEDEGNLSTLHFFPELKDLIDSSEAVKELYLNEMWIDSQDPDFFLQMIVAKPFIKLDDDFYVTGLGLLIDNINWFVESQLFGKNNRDFFTKLPKNIKQGYYEYAFEEEVSEMLNKFGFDCYGVTSTGYVWSYTNRENGFHISKEGCPGEIDVIAFNASLCELILIECKVLSTTITRSEFRNVIGKLGDLDESGFRKKTLKKLEWLKRSSILDKLNHNSDVNYKAMIVTDKEFPIRKMIDNLEYLSFFELESNYTPIDE